MSDHQEAMVEALPPELAPEPPPRGPLVWAKENLFSTPVNSVLTIIFVLIIVAFFRGILAFIFADDRQWDAIATNFRLYMVQAYPEAQILRWWVSLGLVFSLTGLSFAAWRAGGEMSVRRITRSLMGTAGFIAFVFLLAPLAFDVELWFFIVAGVLGFGAYAVDRSLGDRSKEITVPSLGVVAALIGLVILAVWTVPIGKHGFVSGAVIPVEEGTIALSTKLPLTVMALVLVGAYFVGLFILNFLKDQVLRRTLVLGWLLSIPVILLVILRDPDLSYSRFFSVDVPLFLLFALVGGAWIAFLSNPRLLETGRILAGVTLIVAVLTFLFPMLMKIRFLALLLAVFAIGAPAFAGERAERRRYLMIWTGLVLLIVYFTWVANTPSTVSVPTASFMGGLALTFVLAIVGLLISFPIGVIMALGRTSTMPIFRVLSTVYIEVVRGIPFITVLIFADIILELFLPEGISLNDVVQAILATAFFSGAYLAENVRGGLQSIPKGQYEASKALGMSTIQTTVFIVLPQALRAVIPALVGQTISLFKDTSLVAIIGLFDVLFIATKVVPQQTAFIGSRRENLLFVALVYWIFTFAFSRASLRLEKKLGVGER